MDSKLTPFFILVIFATALTSVEAQDPPADPPEEVDPIEADYSSDAGDFPPGFDYSRNHKGYHNGAEDTWDYTNPVDHSDGGCYPRWDHCDGREEPSSPCCRGLECRLPAGETGDCTQNFMLCRCFKKEE